MGFQPNAEIHLDDDLINKIPSGSEYPSVESVEGVVDLGFHRESSHHERREQRGVRHPEAASAGTFHHGQRGVTVSDADGTGPSGPGTLSAGSAVVVQSVSGDTMTVSAQSGSWTIPASTAINWTSGIRGATSFGGSAYLSDEEVADHQEAYRAGRTSWLLSGAIPTDSADRVRLYYERRGLMDAVVASDGPTEIGSFTGALNGTRSWRLFLYTLLGTWVVGSTGEAIGRIIHGVSRRPLAEVHVGQVSTTVDRTRRLIQPGMRQVSTVARRGVQSRPHAAGADLGELDVDLGEADGIAVGDVGRVLAAVFSGGLSGIPRAVAESADHPDVVSWRREYGDRFWEHEDWRKHWEPRWHADYAHRPAHGRERFFAGTEELDLGAVDALVAELAASYGAPSGLVLTEGFEIRRGSAVWRRGRQRVRSRPGGLRRCALRARGGGARSTRDERVAACPLRVPRGVGGGDGGTCNRGHPPRPVEDADRAHPRRQDRRHAGADRGVRHEEGWLGGPRGAVAAGARHRGAQGRRRRGCQRTGRSPRDAARGGCGEGLAQGEVRTWDDDHHHGRRRQEVGAVERGGRRRDAHGLGAGGPGHARQLGGGQVGPRRGDSNPRCDRFRG